MECYVLSAETLANLDAISSERHGDTHSLGGQGGTWGVGGLCEQGCREPSQVPSRGRVHAVLLGRGRHSGRASARCSLGLGARPVGAVLLAAWGNHAWL